MSMKDILEQSIKQSADCAASALESAQEGCQRMNRICGDLEFTVADLHDETDKAKEQPKDEVK